MSEYIITCCSTADLDRVYMEELGVPFVMFHYKMNDVSYPDDLYTSITPEAFYKSIAEGAEPVTSQVNAEEYARMFEPILQSGKDVLHLTLSSGISGTLNSANIAKEEMEEKYPGRRVVVIDSLSASSGYGMIVVKARENQQAGMSLEENEAWLRSHVQKQQAWFFSTDLTSYIRGGRVSKTAGFVGTMLSICPLLNMNDEGKLIPRTKHRGKKAVTQEIVKRMQQYAENGAAYSDRCFISQSACREDAEAVAALVRKNFPKVKEVRIFDIGTVIGSHTGPGTVALFFWGENKMH